MVRNAAALTFTALTAIVLQKNEMNMGQIVVHFMIGQGFSAQLLATCFEIDKDDPTLAVYKIHSVNSYKGFAVEVIHNTAYNCYEGMVNDEF